MRILKNFSLVILLLIVGACGTTKPTTTLIMFTNETIQPTNATSITVYNKRLDLPGKYREIGTIKFEGSPKIEEVKKTAAEKGTDALLLDGNNYILIKFENQLEEEEDEKKSS